MKKWSSRKKTTCLHQHIAYNANLLSTKSNIGSFLCCFSLVVNSNGQSSLYLAHNAAFSCQCKCDRQVAARVYSVNAVHHLHLFLYKSPPLSIMHLVIVCYRNVNLHLHILDSFAEPVGNGTRFLYRKCITFEQALVDCL